MNASAPLRSEQPRRPKSMTPKVLSHQSRKGRTPARPLPIETVDEIDESLIETFPASDPPAWVALPVSAFPSDARRSPTAPEKYDIPDHRYNIAGSPSNCGDKRRITDASCFFFTAKHPAPSG